MKKAFRDNLGLSKANEHKLILINEIIEQYRKQGYRLTLRQLYYQLVSRDVIPNKDNVCSITVHEKVIKQEVSPLYLMALLSYSVNKLGHFQIEDKEGFDYLKMGMKLSTGEAEHEKRKNTVQSEHGEAKAPAD